MNVFLFDSGQLTYVTISTGVALICTRAFHGVGGALTVIKGQQLMKPLARKVSSFLRCLTQLFEDLLMFN